MELDKRLKLGKLAGGMAVARASGITHCSILPIESAMLNAHDECVKILQKHGSPPARTEITDVWFGRRAFACCRDGRTGDLIELLRSSEAPHAWLASRQRLRTGHCVLPIEAAALNGHDGCVDVLRRAGSQELGSDFSQVLAQYMERL